MKTINSKSAVVGRLALIVIVVAGLLGLATPAQAQVYNTCDRWGSWSQGTWTIHNNIWGENGGRQCLTVNSIKSWYIDANHSGGGIKSYPNTSVRPQTPLNQLNSAGFWFDTSSAPVTSGDNWGWTADLWSTNNQDEIMVFTSWTPGPLGGWGRQVASNVTVGGIHYSSVWQADPGWNVLQFVPSQQRSTGTIDAAAIWRWSASQNLLRNTTFDTMQFGCEISSTSGVQKRYSLNAYSAWWSNTSGGGSSI
jgi:hypothetical protein